jgi:hypothetical protein
MAGASKRFPPLFLVACTLSGIGVLGVGALGIGCIFNLQLPSHLAKGLLYIFIGCIAFGIGELFNHPTTTTTGPISSPNAQQLYRERNACSLGNLMDIGALLLFFAGLSALLFPL